MRRTPAALRLTLTPTPTPTLALALALALALTLVAGCGDGGGELPTLPDTVGGDEGCAQDGDDDAASARALTPATPAEGLICPVGDRDWYRLEVPEAGALLEVTLTRAATLGPVDLRYTLYAADGVTPLGSAADADGADGPTLVTGAHALDPAALNGDNAVYLEVRDEGNDEQDRFNGYELEVAFATVSDPNEPNDGPERATPLAVGDAAEGSITFRGDQDWFALEVPGGAPRLMEVRLRDLAAAATEPQVTLFGPLGGELVELGREWAPYDDDGASELLVVWAAAGEGTHYLSVRDRDDDEWDTAAFWELDVTLPEDPDPLEAGAGNDGPEDPAAIASGDELDGLYLAARADQDWFQLDAPADTTPSRARVLIVDAAPAGAALEAELAVALLAPDADTPCAAGDSCEALTATCSLHADCPSHVCRADGRCAGAGVCLPGGCAVGRWLGSDTGDGVHAALPLVQPGAHYLLVRDRQDRSWDRENAYTLAVALVDEPDAHEPDGVWQPGADAATDREGWRRSAALATAVPYTIVYRDGLRRPGPARPATHPDDWDPSSTPVDVVDPTADVVEGGDVDEPDVTGSEVGGPDVTEPVDASDDEPLPPPPTEIARVEFAAMEGWVSHTADEDWYRLDVPEEVVGADGAAWVQLDWRLTVDYGYAGDDIRVFWTVLRGGGGANGGGGQPAVHASWTTPDLPAEGTVGQPGGDCLYLCHLLDRPLWLRVSDFGRERWDLVTPYGFQVTLQAECPEECDCETNCP